MIIEAHLQCAALEMPLSSDDARWFGPLTKTICENNLVRDEDGWYVEMVLISELGRVYNALQVSHAPKALASSCRCTFYSRSRRGEVYSDRY